MSFFQGNHSEANRLGSLDSRNHVACHRIHVSLAKPCLSPASLCIGRSRCRDKDCLERRDQAGKLRVDLLWVGCVQLLFSFSRALNPIKQTQNSSAALFLALAICMSSGEV